MDRDHEMGIDSRGSSNCSMRPNPEVECQVVSPSPASSIATLVGKPPKPDDSCSSRKTWSSVWDHFTRDENNEDVVMCHHCKKSYACAVGNGTTSLHNHLNRCKRTPFQKDKRQRVLPFQAEPKDINLGWKFDHEVCRKELARMIIIMELPFRFVEHEAFIQYARSLQPNVMLPSRVTVRKDCLELYLDEKAKLKQYFSKDSFRVCLTTDTWTSCQNLSYMCLTAHFIDAQWKLHKKVIIFCQIPGHSGEVIGKAVQQCLAGWDISRIFTITVDNASSNDIGVDYLKKRYQSWNTLILKGKFLHMRCAAHILNLIVKDGLKDLDDSIFRIRSAVRYVRSSPARLQRFRSCAEQEKLEFKGSVCLDVETRWNSTYLILESAIKYRKAFDLLELQDKKFRDEMIREKMRGVPIEADWEHAIAVLPFLKIFYDATKIISGSLYVTSNHLMKEVLGIGLKIGQFRQNNDYNISSMAEKMKLKYDKYYGNLNNINMMLFIALVLDPRHKWQYVKWVIDMSYEPVQAKELQTMVDDTLSKMFEQYSDLHKSKTCKSVSKQKAAANVALTKELDEADFLTQMYMNHTGAGHEKEKTELEKFLAEALEPYTNDFDILVWWGINCQRYPIISSMARDALAMPISTVASESAFSTGGRVLDPFRSSLSPKMVEALICSQDWLRHPSNLLDVDEYVNGLETFEDDSDMDSILINLDD